MKELFFSGNWMLIDEVKRLVESQMEALKETEFLVKHSPAEIKAHYTFDLAYSNGAK